jgi:hypothetical protein
MIVTNLPASSDGESAKTGSSPRKPGANPVKRRFILAGMPIAMSLVNRPAFAGSSQCTVSLLASLTHSSEPLVDLNCGVSPGCWTQHALANTNTWESINSTISNAKYASFRTVFNMPSTWKLSASGGDASLLSVMSGNYTFIYCGASGSSDDHEIPDAGAPKHILAGYLNAIAFNGGLIVNGVHVSGHYPRTPGEITSQLAVLFALTKGGSESKSAFNGRLDSNVVACKTYAYPSGTAVNEFCDVGL